MRAFLIAALLPMVLALAACDAPESQLRQVTIESPESLGLSLREVPASVLRSIGLGYGLSVMKAGNVAERAGLRIGDVIYAVNETRLRSIEDFTRTVTGQTGGSLSLLVRRGSADFYVPMDLSTAPRPGPPSKDTLQRT
ncbi:MAG TPA: PDZ domain-containing protein [Burkholderiales bacterium]|nr:PDZ domain-containing protein [Burkholderiales bacterium]